MNSDFNAYNQSSVVWVPCIPDYASGSYIPVYNLSNIPHSINCNVSKISRGGMKSKPWLPQEDQQLIELINQFGKKKWSKIAKHLNNQFHQERIGKNCRERWNNHLNPEINKGEWSYEEDLNLLVSYKKYGRKWSSISKILKGRTENAVKNRWNVLVKNLKDSVGISSDEFAVEYLISHLQEELKKVESNCV